MVLCPAACHPLYPTQSGVLPDGGRRFEVYGYCFRHEPSTDPFRMQAFRMHEFVYLGTPDGPAPTATSGSSAGSRCSPSLGLEIEPVVANDPFFGRPGRMLAANQRSEELKIELVAPVFAAGRPTAISSSNCHLDHFARPFGIDHRRRRGGPHGLLRLRGRPDHPGPAGPARDRSRTPGPPAVRSVLWP